MKGMRIFELLGNIKNSGQKGVQKRGRYKYLIQFEGQTIDWIV